MKFTYKDCDMSMKVTRGADKVYVSGHTTLYTCIPDKLRRTSVKCIESGIYCAKNTRRQGR